MNNPLPFRDISLPFKERTKDLMGRLSLWEKMNQLLFASPAVPRLGIEEYNWWNECLHGVARAGLATVFPQAIGLAATFDCGLMGRVATAISDEGRAKHHENARRGDHDFYHGLDYWSPNINIFRDPRWGRGQETYGECPYLTGRMAVAFIKGIQGEHEKYLKAVATAKHYAVHSGPEAERHSFNATCDEKDLRETYLPAFYDCVKEAKVESIMGAYNRTNGEPCCASQTLMEDILRKEWGFEGYYVSDCGGIEDFHTNHKVTETPEQSAALAVKLGCDLNCGKIYESLRAAYEQGLLTEAHVDTCLERLLMARMKLGMFDPPEQVPYTDIPYDIVDCDKHRALAHEAAQQAIVLLKNEDGLLPLKKDVGAIAVIGPNADNRDVLLGNYHGTPSRLITPMEGIRQVVGDQSRILYAPGCDLYGIEGIAAGKATREFAEAVAVAERADVVVMIMGLSPRLEGEAGDAMNADASGDRRHIGLSGAQDALLATIHATGKPMVLVVESGSAISVPWAQQHLPAIVQQFYGGQTGGLALAEVLFGEHNPAGRMPVTIYEGLHQLPPFEDYSMANRTYRYFEGEPLYPFGFGLSYTEFGYSNLVVEKADAGGLSVKAVVENKGDAAGDEVVQVYFQHEDPPFRMPLRQLGGFQRVHLAPGETCEVSFMIKAEQLRMIDDEGCAHDCKGAVTIHLGGSQPDQVSRRLGAPECLAARVEV